MPSVEQLVEQGKKDCRGCHHCERRVERLDFCRRKGPTLKDWKQCSFERYPFDGQCGPDATYFQPLTAEDQAEFANRKKVRQALLDKYPGCTEDQIVEKEMGFFSCFIIRSLGWWGRRR